MRFRKEYQERVECILGAHNSDGTKLGMLADLIHQVMDELDGVEKRNLEYEGNSTIIAFSVPKEAKEFIEEMFYLTNKMHEWKEEQKDKDDD